MKTKSINLLIILITNIAVIIGLNGCNVFSKSKKIVIICDTISNAIVHGIMVNNIKEGYWIHQNFYKNEDSIYNNIITIEEYYKNDKLDGPFKLYWDDGRLMNEGYRKNNILDGAFIYYFDNGNIRLKGLYKNGKKNGIGEEYTVDGRLDKRTLFKKDTSIILLDNHLSMPSPTK